MELSEDGLFFLARKEGIVPGPYLDSVGVWTYGIGHAETSGREPNPKHMKRGMPDDLDAELMRVFEVFREDMVVFSDGVRAAFTAPLKQHEFDAAVSFHYNTGAIGRATWVKSFNAGDRARAVEEIMNWKKPPEIIGRRMQEQNLFDTGDYGSGDAPVYGVNEEGRYGLVIRTLSKADFLALLGGAPATPGAYPAPKPPAGPAKKDTIWTRIRGFFGGNR